MFCEMKRLPKSSMVEPNCAGPDAASAFPLIGSKRKSVPRTSTGAMSG